MSQNPCANTHKLRPCLLRVSLLGTFLLAAVALFGNTGCEDKAIGRPCDVLTDAGNSQGVFNSEALECPSRICLKPVVQEGATMPDPPTTAYCSASCSQDSDCDGQTRASCNPATETCRDKRCSKGFACGIAFVKGKICCQKLCLCKDFLNPSVGAPTPIACQGTAAATCDQ
jgi:hypothetical protein